MIFYSHNNPKRELKIHLRDVSCRMNDFILQASLQMDKNILCKVGRLIGLGHDFGKYTTYFQNHLLKQIETPKANHGYVSALFTFYLINKFVYKEEHNEKDKIFSLLAYISVLHHHGNLENLDSDCISNSQKGLNRRSILESQLEDLLKRKKEIEKEYMELGINIDLEDFIAEYDELIHAIRDLSFDYDDFEDEEKEYFYSVLMFLYSVLIDSDKREAAGTEFIKRREIPKNIVDIYKKEEFADTVNNRINRFREEVYNKVMNKVSQISLDNHLLSLTSPTGSGKTLTSFAAALHLREKIKNEKGYIPRIIYSLPFTSIIDQNYDRLSDVLSKLKGFELNRESYIIKHHHLADISYIKDDKEKALDEALLLIESWESEVIVTTFIQFLYTVLGYKNSFLKKFHNIAGSIILLDEVQNIPVEYWPLINKALKQLAKYFDCYIILLTATKPLIFNDKEVTELLDNHESYFNQLDRTKIICNLEEKTIENLVDDFMDRYDNNNSYLLVLNTILSSLKVYKKLKAKLADKFFDVKNNLYYLSTNIYPKERQRRIKEIRDRVKAGDKLVVVSTQVVEAGVDIDMNVIYRDLGPIDSIIQVAGRGNREWSPYCSKVYVYNLKDSTRPYSAMVYGSIHYNRSKELLHGYNEILESEYYSLVDEFFTKLKEGYSDVDESENLILAMQELNFNGTENSLSSFRLIDERYNYIDLFVYNDESKEIWENFIENVYNEKEFNKKRMNFLKIKKEFQSYIISVPIQLAKNYVSQNEIYNGILKPICDFEYYYDEEIGFKRNLDEEEDLDLRIL